MSTPSIVIRLPNWLGDIVMAQPAVESVRAAYPEATIVGMVRASHLELVRRFDALDDVLVAPSRAGGWGRGIWRAVRNLRDGHFDLALLLAPSFEAALIVWLAGIPNRVGHATDHRGALLTTVVPTRPQHRVEDCLDVAGEVGAGRPDVKGSGLTLTPHDRTYADALLERIGAVRGAKPILVNPAAAKRPRAWSADRFAQLTERLAEQHADRPLLVHDEHPFEWPDRWSPSGRIHRVTGASLVELAAVLERCAVYVGNDSGPMHLAARLGVPTVGIYGSSSPAHTSPRGPQTARHLPVSASFACSPCRERFFHECPTPPTPDDRPPCLAAVTVEMVAAAVAQVLTTSDPTERRAGP